MLALSVVSKSHMALLKQSKQALRKKGNNMKALFQEQLLLKIIEVLTISLMAPGSDRTMHPIIKVLKPPKTINSCLTIDRSCHKDEDEGSKLSNVQTRLFASQINYHVIRIGWQQGR